MTKAEPKPAKLKSHWPMSVLSTLSSLVNMLLPLGLVRMLTPEEIGIFKIFFLYLTIVPAFSFTVGLFSGLAYWAGQAKTGAAAIRVTSLLVIVSSFALTLTMIVFRPYVEQFFGWQTDYVTIFCAGLFGMMTSSFYEEAAIATGRIWTGALFSAGLDLIRTVAIIVTAYLTRSLLDIFIVHVALQLAKAFIGYGLGWREGLVSFAWDTKVFRSVWRYAFPVSVAWGFGVLVRFSDQMILSKVISNAEFAFYSIGCLSVPPLIVLETSITRVLIPQMSAAFAEDSTVRAAALYRKAVAELTYLTLPAVTGMIVFAAPIIELLFTKRYLSASNYLGLYALFYLTQIIPNDAVARARGQGKWILWNFISFSVFTVATCWLLTLKFGPYGALIGLISTRLLMKLYAIGYMKSSAGWKLADFLPFAEMGRSLTTCVGLGLLCVAAHPLFTSNLAWFFIMGIAFSVLYFAITIVWAGRSIPFDLLNRIRKILRRVFD